MRRVRGLRGASVAAGDGTARAVRALRHQKMPARARMIERVKLPLVEHWHNGGIHIKLRVPQVANQDDAVRGAVVPDLVLWTQPNETSNGRSNGTHHAAHHTPRRTSHPTPHITPHAAHHTIGPGGYAAIGLASATQPRAMDAVGRARCARVCGCRRDLARPPQMNRQRRGTCPPPTASPRCRRGSSDPPGRRVCTQRGGDSEDTVSTPHRHGHGRPGYTGGVVQRGGSVRCAAWVVATHGGGRSWLRLCWGGRRGSVRER